MTETNYTNWQRVSNGDTKQFNLPSDHTEPSNLDVQFRGVTQTFINSNSTGVTPSTPVTPYAWDVKTISADTFNDGETFSIQHEIEVNNAFEGVSVWWGTHWGDVLDYSTSYGYGGFANRGESDYYEGSSSYTVHSNEETLTWDASEDSQVELGAWLEVGAPANTEVVVSWQLLDSSGTLVDSGSASTTFDGTEDVTSQSTSFPSTNNNFQRHVIQVEDLFRLVPTASEPTWDDDRSDSALTITIDLPDGSSVQKTLSDPYQEQIYETTQNFEGESVTISLQRESGFWDDPLTNSDFSIRTEYTYSQQTQNPDVDDPDTSVSAAYDGLLADGETTGWLNYPHFANGGSNDYFKHSYNTIGGSGTVDVRFRYNYELPAPTPRAIGRVYQGGTTYDLPIVDPNDNQVDYDIFRVEVNGTEYIADLVNTTDDNASPVRVYTPQHGVLAWRKNIQ